MRVKPWPVAGAGLFSTLIQVKAKQSLVFDHMCSLFAAVQKKKIPLFNSWQGRTSTEVLNSSVDFGSVNTGLRLYYYFTQGNFTNWFSLIHVSLKIRMNY